MARFASSGMHARSIQRTRKFIAVLGVTALTAGGLVAASAPANADLASVSPAVADGFPAFYTDATGLSLQLCLDSITLCIADQTGPISAPDGEAFYWAADASAGGLDAHWALEAAFGETDNPEVFQRTQYSSSDGALQPNSTYTITDPFTSATEPPQTCPTDGAGEIANNACRTETDAALGFGGAVTGRLGPFLTATSGAPVGYIGGGPDSLSTVTGSPTGFNMLRVEGPGITSTCAGGTIPSCAETALFAVSGKIADGPGAVMNTDPLDFGNTSAVTSQNITYSSIGTTSASVTSASVTPNNAAFSADASACSSVASGASCNIVVTYSPTAGDDLSATLTINDNTPGTGRTVALSGSSLPVSSLSGNSLAFGRQKVTSGASAAKIVTVSNDGAAPLSVSGASTGSSQFQPTNGCSTAVAPGASCDISVVFDPSSTGAKTGTLSITTDGGNRTVSLTGSGTQSAISAASRISYGSTALGSQTGKVLTVTNSGDAAMAVGAVSVAGANARDFGMGGAAVNPCRAGLTVPVGGSCRVGVTFRPRALGSRSATLRISADGAQHLVALGGVGVDRTRPGVVSVSPSRGATAVGRGNSVSVRFSEAVRGVSRSTFALTNRSTGNKVRATLVRTGNRYVLNPRARLASGTRYTVRLIGGRAAIRDMSNNTLRSTTWGFRTR